MTKQEFLNKIKNGISRLNKSDIDHYIQFYSEMIDDRIEDGMLESEAVSAMGNPDDIISEILREKRVTDAENKTEKSVVDEIKAFSNKYKTLFWVTIAIITFPIWISLLSVVLGVVIGVISVLIGLFAASFALAVSSLGCIAGAVIMLCNGMAIFVPLLIIGGGFICGGLAILMFMAANFFRICITKLVKFLIGIIKTKKFKKEESM